MHNTWTTYLLLYDADSTTTFMVWRQSPSSYAINDFLHHCQKWQRCLPLLPTSYCSQTSWQIGWKLNQMLKTLNQVLKTLIASTNKALRRLCHSLIASCRTVCCNISISHYFSSLTSWILFRSLLRFLRPCDH